MNAHFDAYRIDIKYDDDKSSAVLLWKDELQEFEDCVKNDKFFVSRRSWCGFYIPKDKVRALVISPDEKPPKEHAEPEAGDVEQEEISASLDSEIS